MRAALASLAALALCACGLSHQDMPWTPLSLEESVGAATSFKLARLREDPAACAEILAASGLAFTPVTDTETADPQCSLENAVVIEQSHFPYGAPVRVSCPLAAALYLWERDVVTPAAAEHLGAEIARIDHGGSFSCRRLYGRSEGAFSEHASANAIDVVDFRLKGGGRVSVEAGWNGDPQHAAFLRAVRDGSCDLFRGVLGPDYNAAHADHFHLDMGPYSICR